MADKKILKFELSPRDVKIKNLLMNDFIMIDIYAISDIKVNRNHSHFTLDGMQKAIPTVYNKPVLGAFDVKQNDFKGHDTVGLTIDPEYNNLYFDYSDGKSEVPLGVIREQDTIDIVQRDGLNWLHFTCVLWAKYNYKGVKRLLKDGKKHVSVEIEVIKSHVEDGVEIIEEFTFDGVTILRSRVIEAIPNASMTILEKLDDAVYQKQEKCLSFAYKALDEALNTASVTDTVSTANTQEVDTQLKESFDTNVDNDEQSPVDNEGTEEITMNDEQKGGENLTYEEKRQLLELALNRSVHNDNGEDDCTCRCYVWVADIDDTNVYYQSGDEGYYSAPYHFEETEEGIQAVIDFENKVAVVRSWKQYAEENPEEKKEDNKEVEACNEEEKKEEEACHETEEESDEGEKKSVMEENSESESCEGKECEAKNDSDEENTEDKPSEENKEEESCEDKQEEGCDKSEFAAEEETAKKEFAEKNLKDDGKPEGEDATVSTSETEMEQHDDSNINENDGDDTLPQEAAQEMGIVFTVGEKQFTAEEFQAEYERVSNALAEMTEKYNAVNAEVMAKKNEDFCNFAYEVVAGETDLTAENADSIKNAMKESCMASKFSSNEEVQEAAESLIANALYAQKKMSKKTNSEEFSASIVKNNTSDSETVNVGVNANLKSAIEKLRKI